MIQKKIWRCWRSVWKISNVAAKGQTAYSSVILGNVGNQLLTMQITLPADDQQKAQTTAENIINTLVIQ
ncbi:hypothetical protein OkiPb00396_11040 [Escherichia coli]